MRYPDIINPFFLTHKMVAIKFNSSNQTRLHRQVMRPYDDGVKAKPLTIHISSKTNFLLSSFTAFLMTFLTFFFFFFHIAL